MSGAQEMQRIVVDIPGDCARHSPVTSFGRRR